MPYRAYVVSESADQVSRIQFGPGGARVERAFQVGSRPTEIDGPHGVAASPDGEWIYVTLGHGTPAGSLWKISARDDSVAGRVTLGSFPATVDVSPDGRHAWVSNFNLHGDMVPSSVSKVDLRTMTETARTETCAMPHGSRINARGTRHFSVCMMDDLLVEIDAVSGTVLRRFSVAPGHEGPAHSASQHTGGHAQPACSPTWAQPSPDGARVYVACNKTDQILEIDTGSWTVTRRLDTGPGPYNLAVTADGRRLLATLKNRTAPAVEVIDLETGAQVARIGASGVLPHGVVATPDGRFALTTVEGVGSEPGRVDLLDLRTLRRTATVEVGPQAGGVALLNAP